MLSQKRWALVVAVPESLLPISAKQVAKQKR